MSYNINDKSDRELLITLLGDIQLVKKKLDIEENRFCTIANYEIELSRYEEFAINTLDLNPGTIKNHTIAIKKFLEFSKGEVNYDITKEYLDSSDSKSQANILKSLRRFIRDYLKLGNWINEIQFKTEKTKLKTEKLSNNKELSVFCSEIQTLEIQVIFLICFNSGLRINEVLQIERDKINYDLNCIDVSDIHQGGTKSSWYGFFTEQTKEYLQSHIENSFIDDKIFDVSYDQVYAEFKRVSEITKIELTPKSLRTIFVERCIDCKIDKNVIDIFEGRIPKGVQSRIYRNYSSQRLKEHYNKVEESLTL